MATVSTYRAKRDGQGNIIYLPDGTPEGELVSEVNVPDEVPAPNWNALKQALWNNSALLGKAYMSCAAKPSNAAAIAFLVGALKDGETGTGTQNGFLKAWQMIDVAWTDAEKATVNGYLTDNNFTITV